MSDNAQEELARWISQKAIAGAILEELKSQGIAPTVENGQTVWLDVLENGLPEGITSSVKYRFALS